MDDVEIFSSDVKPFGNCLVLAFVDDDYEFMYCGGGKLGWMLWCGDDGYSVFDREFVWCYLPKMGGGGMKKNEDD